MVTATVSSKGQITLPAGMRKKLGIGVSEKVVLESQGNVIVIRKAKDFFKYEGFAGKALFATEERVRMAKGASDHVRGRGK
jgi:AbrB family looped-hinge helix DNA binding protein